LTAFLAKTAKITYTQARNWQGRLEYHNF